MTALDDALNSATPIFDRPDLTVQWEELPGESGGQENLTNLGDTLTGEYVVNQSFDDGLPDPVTMTGSNDASGKLTTSLVGRPGHVFNGWTSLSASGTNAYTNTYIGGGLPSGVPWGALVFVAVVVPSATAFLDQGEFEGTTRAWDLVARETSGNTSMWLFSKRAYTGMEVPFFRSTVSVTNTVWGAFYLSAKDPAGNELHWRVNASAQGVAPGSATAHVQPSLDSTSPRSVFLALWASPGVATWNAGTTDIALVNESSSTVALGMARTFLYDSPQLRTNITATRSVASSEVAMMVLAIEPYERPTMAPVEYWSPFNEDSPTYELPRDSAQVQLGFNTVTAEGVQGTVLFNGEMEDIVVGSGGEVELSASSKLRMDLNSSVNLPVIFGRREGGSIDFLLAWIAARADKFIGSAPGPYTRWWVPCYGSLHGGLDAAYGYCYGQLWTATSPGNGVRYPEFIEGVYHTAAYACHTETKVQEVVLTAADLYRSTEIWPWVRENYFETQYLRDLLSLDNNTGRFSFWIRGDANYAGTPSFLASGNRFLFSFIMTARKSNNDLLGQVWFFMEPLDRVLRIQIGTLAGGTSTVSFPGNPLPSDDQWHFVAISWDFVAGTARVRMDGYTNTSNAWVATNDTTGWYDTDADLYEAGGKVSISARFHLPVSDVILEASPEVHTTWADIYPTPPWPSFTITARPTMQSIQTTIDDSPTNAWDTIADLARNTMSMYRANEWDELEFLPQQYFGEAAQQDVAYITDTEVNAQELDIVTDASMSRNHVTVKYSEALVDLNISRVLTLTSAMEIPAGTNEIKFNLDVPVAEIHGASDPYGSMWDVFLVPVHNPTFVPTVQGHWMIANEAPDGSSFSIYTSLSARVIDYTQSTVTLRFKNLTGKSLYLASSFNPEGNEEPMPVLTIYGYAIKTAEAYASERDGKARRDRSMEVEMPWIQDRFTAQQMASRLASRLFKPRPQVTVEVVGDPRRIPGQLVTLADASSTRASGNWRVLAISHNADGPGFTQTLRLTKVDPVGIWDESRWGHAVWGE